MLKNFSEHSPTKDDVLRYRERILVAARQEALGPYVTPADIQQLQQTFSDENEMLFKATIADSAGSQWIFNSERLATYDLLYPRVRRLEQLIYKIERHE